jgi:lantibiotic modifying enzyme
VLAATDVHCDNLIAHGDDPVVVDLEMLLNPGAMGDFDPLVRTGMLPNWQIAPDGRRFDASALGADREQRPGVAVPEWRHINSDQMMRLASTAGGPSLDHRVRLGDTWPTALKYIDALSRGFAAAYRCFLHGRDDLYADSDIHSALTGLELRVLLRETNTYARLLLHLLQPDLLRDGLDRSIELEWLARPLSLELSAPSARRAIYDMERRALENQDIPRFTTSVWNALAFAGEDQELAALGQLRTPEAFFQRLETLSEADLREQLAAIKKAVHHRFGTETGEPRSSTPSQLSTSIRAE